MDKFQKDVIGGAAVDRLNVREGLAESWDLIKNKSKPNVGITHVQFGPQFCDPLAEMGDLRGAKWRSKARYSGSGVVSGTI